MMNMYHIIMDLYTFHVICHGYITFVKRAPVFSRLRSDIQFVSDAGDGYLNYFQVLRMTYICKYPYERHSVQFKFSKYISTAVTIRQTDTRFW